MGDYLMRKLLEEFKYEFPSNREVPLFLRERGYDTLELPSDWEISREMLEGE